MATTKTKFDPFRASLSGTPVATDVTAPVAPYAGNMVAGYDPTVKAVGSPGLVTPTLAELPQLSMVTPGMQGMTPQPTYPGGGMPQEQFDALKASQTTKPVTPTAVMGKPSTVLVTQGMPNPNPQATTTAQTPAQLAAYKGTLQNTKTLATQYGLKDVATLLDSIPEGDTATLTAFSARLQDFISQSKMGQVETQKNQAASGETKKATETLMTNLAQISKDAATGRATAADAWTNTLAKADEYVATSNKRMADVVSKFDNLHTEMKNILDTKGPQIDYDPSILAKTTAHDMQVAVQQTMGTMGEEERNIRAAYGTDSAEYAQFQAQKQQTLATLSSSILSNSAKLEAQMKLSYDTLKVQQDIEYQKMGLGALTTLGTAGIQAEIAMATNVQYSEQNRLEMGKQYALAAANYSLQESQLNVNVAQLMAAGQENWANWLIATPTVFVSAAPLVTYLADLIKNANQEENLQGTNSNFSIRSGQGTGTPTQGTQAQAQTQAAVANTPAAPKAEAKPTTFTYGNKNPQGQTIQQAAMARNTAKKDQWPASASATEFSGNRP